MTHSQAGQNQTFPDRAVRWDSHAYVHAYVIVTGDAKYDIDLLLAPILAVAYLFGNNLIATWNAAFKPRPSIVTIGVEEQNYVQTADPRKKKASTNPRCACQVQSETCVMPIRAQD